MRQRIIGGERAYKQALDELYYGAGERMHNPVIQYEFTGVRNVRAPGFRVTSGLIPRDRDQLVVCWGSIDANTGRENRPAYRLVRREILRRYAELTTVQP